LKTLPSAKEKEGKRGNRLKVESGALFDYSSARVEPAESWHVSPRLKQSLDNTPPETARPFFQVGLQN
jgi:hypothetical protein